MPNSAPPKSKVFVRRLLAYEASVNSASARDAAAFRVCEKLREPLGKLIGVGGFRSLLSRGLALAGVEIPFLHELQVKADGSLDGLEELEAKLESRAVAEGEIVLVSQLIGLLETFIGPALTLRLLHDIWPEIDELSF